MEEPRRLTSFAAAAPLWQDAESTEGIDARAFIFG